METIKARLSLQRLAHSREVVLLITLGVIALAASILSPYFFNAMNFTNILIAVSLDTVIIVGMTMVLVGGGIDLSVGSTLGFCATILARPFGAGIGSPVAIVIALVCGIAIGVINGLLIAYVGIDPLITTLGTMTIWRSATYITAGGNPLSDIPVSFKAFAQGNLLGIPNLFVIGLISIVVFDILLKSNTFFRKYYFVGGSEKSAFRAGIKVKWLKFLSYVITAVCSAVAAVLLVSRMGSAFPHSGLGTEMRVISACVIGGCSVVGGKGTILGSFLGVVLLALINNILVLIGIKAEWQGVVSGMILILAVLSDAIMLRREQW